MDKRAFRAKDASAYIGVGRTHFYELVKTKRLPSGKALTAGCVVWFKEDLDAFLDGVKAGGEAAK